jgi:uncharacterized alkaline shock family protein YloU
MSENTNIDTMDYGNVNISDDVIGTITAIAASEIEGVSSLGSQNITEKLGLKTNAKGVRVEIAEDKVVVDLNIIVDYGTRIPDVCYKVQENVKKAIETMTGLCVTSINVHVNGIDMKSVKTAAAASDLE